MQAVNQCHDRKIPRKNLPPPFSFHRSVQDKMRHLWPSFWLDGHALRPHHNVIFHEKRQKVTCKEIWFSSRKHEDSQKRIAKAPPIVNGVKEELSFDKLEEENNENLEIEPDFDIAIKDEPLDQNMNKKSANNRTASLTFRVNKNRTISRFFQCPFCSGKQYNMTAMQSHIKTFHKGILKWISFLAFCTSSFLFYELFHFKMGWNCDVFAKICLKNFSGSKLKVVKVSLYSNFACELKLAKHILLPSLFLLLFAKLWALNFNIIIQP